MTTLREAAELALAALEYHTHQTRPIHNTELAIESLRSALEAPKPPAKPATLIDVTIDDEGALSLLRDMVVQENGDLTPVRLLIGDGHSGHGLYITSADYPEEGAWLIAPVPPAQRIPENCGSGHCSCIECLKPPEPGLFINMIAQHVGLAEELKTPEPKDKVSVFGGPEMRKMILEKLTKSHDAKYYSNAIAACVSRSGIDGIAYDQSSFMTGYEQGKYDEEMRQGPAPKPEPGEREALITKLNPQECCQAHGGAGSRVGRCEDCPRTIADMLANDVSKSAHEFDTSNEHVDLVNEPGKRKALIARLHNVLGVKAEYIDLVHEAADMLEADTPFEPDWVDYKNGFEAGKAEAIPEGYVLVPIEPTQEMLSRARDWSIEKYGIGVGNDGATGCYKAMLATAPKGEAS